jgi:hypothetical protein
MRKRLWILLAVGFFSGCARQYDVWRMSDSPDGRSRASVERYSSLANGFHVSCRVQVASPGKQQLIYPGELNASWGFYADNVFHFAELAWSPDSKVVAVFVLGPPERFPPHKIWFAYDVARSKVVDPSAMTKLMQDTIWRNYRTKTKHGDGFDGVGGDRSSQACLDSQALRTRHRVR